MYRLFGIVALLVGAALLIGGALFSMPAAAITGGIIALAHGVTVQILLAAEGRREPESRQV
jgi:hypothetical protein